MLGRWNTTRASRPSPAIAARTRACRAASRSAGGCAIGERRESLTPARMSSAGRRRGGPAGRPGWPRASAPGTATRAAWRPRGSLAAVRAAGTAGGRDRGGAGRLAGAAARRRPGSAAARSRRLHDLAPQVPHDLLDGRVGAGHFEGGPELLERLRQFAPLAGGPRRGRGSPTGCPGRRAGRRSARAGRTSTSPTSSRARPSVTRADR